MKSTWTESSKERSGNIEFHIEEGKHHLCIRKILKEKKQEES